MKRILGINHYAIHFLKYSHDDRLIMNHRDGDLPAILDWIGTISSSPIPDARVFYIKNGMRHRDGQKPALIFNDSGDHEQYYFEYDHERV